MINQKLLLAFMIGLSSSITQAANVTDYFPLTLGSYWTYENSVNPSDTYTWSVFESFTFDGHSALKFGTVDDYTIISSDGASVNLYAQVEGGVLYDFPDVSFTTVTDGMVFSLNPATPAMFRFWDNLDATQKLAYNVNASLPDLLLTVGFDSSFSSNTQNNILLSNLGFPAPDYAVTNFQLNQPGVGQIIDFDVNAATGEINKRYNLVDYYIAPVPVPSALWMFASALAGFIGFNRRKTTQQ